jgi:hypothetical protein
VRQVLALLDLPIEHACRVGHQRGHVVRKKLLLIEVSRQLADNGDSQIRPRVCKGIDEAWCHQNMLDQFGRNVSLGRICREKTDQPPRDLVDYPEFRRQPSDGAQNHVYGSWRHAETVQLGDVSEYGAPVQRGRACACAPGHKLQYCLSVGAFGMRRSQVGGGQSYHIRHGNCRSSDRSAGIIDQQVEICRQVWPGFFLPKCFHRRIGAVRGVENHADGRPGAGSITAVCF